MVNRAHDVTPSWPPQVTITKYEGARGSDGLFEGTGCAEFTSGNKYTGTFERGHMHGHGEYVWTDGLVYTGDFMKNKITGAGVRLSLKLCSVCNRQVVLSQTTPVS